MAKKKNVRTYRRGSTWTYSFETANVGGKRKPVTKGGFPTEEEAYKAGMTALADHINGLKRPEPVTISYGDFLDHWLRNVQIHEVKPKSYEAEEILCRKHIIPELGHIKLAELSRTSIKTFLIKKTEEGYSKSTITILKALITKSLRAAITEYNYISDNPARDITLPKAALKRKQNHRQALSKDDQARLLSYFPNGSNEYMAVLIGLHCGTRIGEAFALTWDDIDLDAGTLNIDKQIQNIGGRYVIDSPKYDSCRVITIDADLIKRLRLFRKTRLEEKLRTVDYPNTLIFEDLSCEGQLKEFDLIFRKANGLYFSRYAMSCALRRAQKYLDMSVDFHTLRYTHCTDLIIAGALPKAVQHRLGHKRIEITLNIYTSVTQELDDQVSEILNTRLYAK